MRAAFDERAPASAAPAAAPGPRRLGALRSYRALAATLAVVVVGLAAWVGLLIASGDDHGALLTYSYRGRGGETTLLIQTVVGEPPATVTAEGMRRLEAGEAYHLWAIRGDAWLRAAVFNTNPEGSWRDDVDFVFERGDEVAVTIGSAAGDDRPEREPLFRSPI
jgi:hypothetical protein